MLKKCRIYTTVAAVAIVIVLAIAGCGKKPDAGTSPESEKFKITATLYPLWDFARNIGGERAAVSLLLPPGSETHSFEPKPGDIVAVRRADLFIYTGPAMEPWVEDFAGSIDNKKLKVVDSSAGIELMKEPDGDEHGETHGAGHRHRGSDPHIWLDFGNAIKMIETISRAMSEADAVNADFYAKNAAEYVKKLKELDKKYFSELAPCPKREFIHGGHFAFGYLAKRYGLRYMAAQGFSPDSEPSARQLIALTEQIKKSGLKHIYYEELVDPKTARTIARETGATLLQLHGAHNISKEDFENKVSFLSLMEKNLINLRAGLQCGK